jgi:hypothetical protein
MKISSLKNPMLARYLWILSGVLMILELMYSIANQALLAGMII